MNEKSLQQRLMSVPHKSVDILSLTPPPWTSPVSIPLAVISDLYFISQMSCKQSLHVSVHLLPGL